MTGDIEYLSHYKQNTLYVNPEKQGKGAYASFLVDGEELMFELEVNERFRLALSMFYLNRKDDYSRFKLTKIKFHKTRGWERDGEVIINGFTLAKLKEFVELLSGISLLDATKSKISLENLTVQNLTVLLNSDKGVDILKQLSDTPGLSEDIFALAYKKAALEVFRDLLGESDDYKKEYVQKHSLRQSGEEQIWQHFFECNPWIFGHGLNYVFLNKADKKLETTTTGYSHTSSGNRVDALMRSQALISQYVLIEIKKPSSCLIQKKDHRTGCWAISSDVAEAVSQIQKTLFDFTANQTYKVQSKNAIGDLTGEEIFRVKPKSYLVIGNLKELCGNDDKIICFQLFRNSLTSPEILTYDELYERARCIVETISHFNKEAR